MAFQRGISGNPQGRPAGTGNKVTKEVRLRIKEFVESEFQNMEGYFAELSAKDKIEFIVRLLPYTVPKFEREYFTHLKPDYVDPMKELLNIQNHTYIEE